VCVRVYVCICRPAPVLQPAGNGAYVLVNGNRSSLPPSHRNCSNVRLVVPVAIVRRRHVESIGRSLNFGSLNVRSLSPSKLDDVLAEFRDRLLDVMLLCETWHDADSVSIRRLRSEGYTVVERARPRRVDASLDVNHGGVAIVAAAGIRLTAVRVGPSPSTFECVAARVTSRQSSCLVLVVYRPGSSAVTGKFFSELADVLEHLSTSTDPLVLAGDVNIRLERQSDSNTVAFSELMSSHGLVQLVHGATHDQGGTLDVVCTRDDRPLPTVDVVDNGLSDHRLLCWRSC